MLCLSKQQQQRKEKERGCMTFTVGEPLFSPSLFTAAFPALTSQNVFLHCLWYNYSCANNAALPSHLRCKSFCENACSTSVSCFINTRHGPSAASPTHQRPNKLKQMREVAGQSEFISHHLFNGSWCPSNCLPSPAVYSGCAGRGRCGKAVSQRYATKARRTFLHFWAFCSFDEKALAPWHSPVNCNRLPPEWQLDYAVSHWF